MNNETDNNPSSCETQTNIDPLVVESLAETLRSSGSDQDSEPRASELINQVQDLINRHIYFQDPETALLIAVWVLGTYLYKEFTYYGYLWVTSAVKGSGKTRLLTILSHICNDCPAVLANVTEAVLFREAEAGKTLILDEAENLNASDRQSSGALMRVINAGFQRGSQIPRTEPDPDNPGKYKTVYFSPYCPKVIAGLSDVLDTIESRSFKIVMTKKATDEVVERFNLRLLEAKLGELRGRIKRWSLVKKAVIGEKYSQMESTYRAFKGLDDRMVDIVEPLAMIAVAADCEVDPPRKIYLPRLLAVVRSMAQQKKSANSNLMIQVIVNVCEDEFKKSPQSHRVFIPSQIFVDELRSAGEAGITPWKLSSFMRKLGGNLALSSVSNEELRSYNVTQAWLEELKQRYSSELSEL